MTRLNVVAIYPRDAVTGGKIIAANFGMKNTEVPPAPFWTDMPEPHVNTHQWHNHLGTMMIEPVRKADRFPPLKSQREINDESGPNLRAWLVMFSSAAAVALIMAGFDWLVGAM